jgi:prepilin-type N-terminal cleavage/methylation domain-containing protein
MKHEFGFTLLELLLVIALLSVTAGVVVQGYEGVQDQGRYDAARFEMAELRKALLQFRRDSGTNDFPGQGIYDCTALADEAIDNGRPATWTQSVPEVNIANRSDWIDWCQSPANFWMLFADPLGSGWNPDTHRGWHGPYLQRKSGLLSYGNVDDVWGIADPYRSPFILMGNDDAAHIVSFGPDKTHDGEDAIPCEPPAGSDDTVLCLLQ